MVSDGVRGSARGRLGGLGAAEGRGVSSASVFSTILLNRMVELHGSGRASTVVDVGCGSAPYRDLLSPDRYVGIDRTPRVPEGAATFLVGDVEALPVADGVADGVLCTEVIEHVGDEHRLAAELYRVARPGARLVLTSPFVHGLHEQPYDFRRLTTLGLVRVLDGAGWDVERVVSVGGPTVVTVDSAVRSVDGAVRRVVRKTFGKGPVLAAVGTVSARIQQLLAAVALLSPVARLGPIDPSSADPRLTLGYVVVATRR